ncbi:uncharacterized protein N7484_010944 [Penicillium longicatenatum]|uniref:uncharacterized protein n=1 Tax=Penicillium longicatenatum TaxID=1561947 RepID=UPI002548E9EB|nr:uncharacterized protein N7484_010944 [Penicillium longicatenatum]KAJ5630844.1 hypothetical protein N7484_010944 [Penicillium longicatenatum]
MSPTKKIIAVVGATGAQGSSVARTFLALPNWHVRCLTRSPSSERAQTLAKQGAELAQADLDDPETLSRAFAGIHAIFLNTDFWDPYGRAIASGTNAATSAKIGYDTEIRFGKNAIDAAREIPTLERFVYSALGPMNAASGGKYPHSYHWETKAYLANYIQSTELGKLSSFIYIGGYLTNQFLYPKFRKEFGGYTLILPASKQTRLPIIDTARSTGPFVRALIEEEAPGTKLLAYDEYLNFEEIIKIWSKVTGKQAMFMQMDMQDMHEKFGVPIEVLGGPAFLDEFDYCAGIEGVIEPAQLKSRVDMKSFEELLKGMDVDFLLGTKDLC